MDHYEEACRLMPAVDQESYANRKIEAAQVYATLAVADELHLLRTLLEKRTRR